MNAAEVNLESHDDSNEFRMSIGKEHTELLVLASLFTFAGCFVMYLFSLPWGWYLLAVGQLALYGKAILQANVMEVYTQPHLRYPFIAMKLLGGMYTAGDGLSIVDQSLRLNTLLSHLKKQVGAQHPVFQEVLLHGPYSVRERINHMFEPEVRRDVRKTIHGMCNIINHTPTP